MWYTVLLLKILVEGTKMTQDGLNGLDTFKAQQKDTRHGDVNEEEKANHKNYASLSNPKRYLK